MPPCFLHHIIFGNVTYTYFMYGIVWQSLPTWGMTWKYRRPACIHTYPCLCTCSYDGVQYTRVCVVIWIYTHNKHIHIRISSTAYMYAWPQVLYQEAYPNYHIVGGGVGGITHLHRRTSYHLYQAHLHWWTTSCHLYQAYLHRWTSCHL